MTEGDGRKEGTYHCDKLVMRHGTRCHRLRLEEGEEGRQEWKEGMEGRNGRKAWKEGRHGRKECKEGKEEGRT